MDGPLPAELLKPASLYHSQVALVPSMPPTTLRVLIVPAQVASSVTLMLVGSTDGVLTVTSRRYPWWCCSRLRPLHNRWRYDPVNRNGWTAACTSC